MLAEPRRRTRPKSAALPSTLGLPASQPSDHTDGHRITHRTVGGDDAVDLIDGLRADRGGSGLQLGVLIGRRCSDPPG